MLKVHSSFYFFPFFFMSAFSYAQSISGKLLDKDQKAIPYAEITAGKDGIKRMAMSDENGEFMVSLPENGKYLLEVLQNETVVYSKISIVDGNIHSDLIVQAAKETDIKEVKLTAKKRLVERKIDRLVFNVENSVSAQGGDAMDALKLTPGVRIQGDEIKLSGKSSVKVMVNDRIIQLSGDDLYNYLKSIPVANIRKIEVITNPPAQYDAEGNSGLINIQLKEATQDNWKVTLRSVYQQATYATFLHAVGLTYKKDKFSALVDLNYQYGKNMYTNDINYYYPNEHWNNNIYNRNHQKNLGIVMNLKYNLTKRSSIGTQLISSFSNNTSDEFNNNFSRNYTDGAVIKNYKTEGMSSGKPKNVSLNVNYTLDLDDKGKKFSVDADYFNGVSPKDNNFSSLLQDFVGNSSENQLAINNSHQDIKNYSLKADVELPGSWADFAFGVKATSTTTDNKVDSKFYNKIDESLLSSQADHFLYKENMQMIYISVLKHFGEKWDVKAGLRGENTQTNANSFSVNQEIKRNYFKIFPTAYVSFKPNEDHVLSLNFGRRIQRPGFWEMNPAKWYISPKSYTEGNPFLQPAYSYNIEFNYSYKSLLNLSLYNSNKRDGYGQVTVHDIMNDSQAFKRLNYFDSSSLGGSLTFNYDLFSWWNTATEVSAYYNELNPKIDLFSNFYSGWGGYTTSTNTFSLNKKKTFLATLYYEYNYPAVQGIINSSSSSTLNIGFRSLLFNKKLTVGLNFDDIFRKNLTLYSNRSQDINQTFLQYYDTRQFRISLTYKFGSTKLSMEERETGNQDEKNRSN